MRTFQDFVQLATQKYKISFSEADRFICSRLDYLGLSPYVVICYINWADNDYLTQIEIAKQLGVKPQTVSRLLQKLRQVFPHLFPNLSIKPTIWRVANFNNLSEKKILVKF